MVLISLEDAKAEVRKVVPDFKTRYDINYRLNSLPSIELEDEPKDEAQTDCTEALTLLWIKNMVTDEEFYRIDARLKCISCKWWNDTIVGGSECVSKECTYQPKTEPQTDAFTKWAKSVADSYRDEPQTEVKVEPTWVGVTYGRFEDKPHTERSEQ